MSQVIGNDDTNRVNIAAQLAQNLASYYQLQRSKRDLNKSKLVTLMSAMPDRYKGAEVTVTPEGFEGENQAFLNSFFSPLPQGSRANKLEFEDLPFNQNNDALKMYQENLHRNDEFVKTMKTKATSLLGQKLLSNVPKIEQPKIETDTPDSNTIPDVPNMKPEDETKLNQYFNDLANTGLSAKEIINKFTEDTGLRPSNEQANRIYQANKTLFKSTKKDKNNPLNQVLDPGAGFKSNSAGSSESQGYHVEKGQEKYTYTEEGKRSVKVTETPGYTDYFNDPSYRAMKNTAGILSMLGDKESAQQYNQEADRLGEYLISRNQGPRQSIQTMEGPKKTLETTLPSLNISENEATKIFNTTKTGITNPGPANQEPNAIKFRDTDNDGNQVTLKTKNGKISGTGTVPVQIEYKDSIKDIIENQWTTGTKRSVDNNYITIDGRKVAQIITSGEKKFIKVFVPDVINTTDIGTLSSYEDVKIGT